MNFAYSHTHNPVTPAKVGAQPHWRRATDGGVPTLRLSGPRIFQKFTPWIISAN